MYALFFRSFYIVFVAMYSMLFFASAVIVLSAASTGDPPSTIVGVGVATLCGMLIGRAVKYMRG